jgi:RNA polymerase sigma-70 factor (ECF subfamily)
MTTDRGNVPGASGGGHPEATSTSLLQRARAQDPEAWRRLVKLYGPLVFRWCRLSQIQPSDAADVVQEVFGSVMSTLDRFRRDRPGDSFRGWLWVVTRNKIRDHVRRRGSGPRAAGGTDAQLQIQQLPEVPPCTDTADETRGIVHRALELIRAEFEQRTWQAFWRSAVEGQPAADIAGDLGMTKGAVRQAKYRVLGRLRQELEGLG